MRLSVALSVCLMSAVAFARGGMLSGPQAYVPDGFDAGAVLAVLKADGYRFVSGSFINEFTNFSYAGDTAGLNKFLAGLAACDGIEVRLRFSKEKGVAPLSYGPDAKSAPCQWGISQVVRRQPALLTVTVYLGDGTIDPEQLELPAWHGGRGEGGPARRGRRASTRDGAKGAPDTPSPLTPLPRERGTGIVAVNQKRTTCF
jgi:hypothetical protein